MNTRAVPSAPCIGALALALLAAAPAWAHRIAHPKKDLLRLFPGRAEVIVRYDIEPEELRDRDPEEARRMLVARLGRTVKLTAGGSPVALRVTASSVGRASRGGRPPGEGDEGQRQRPVDRIEITVVLEGTLPRVPLLALAFADQVEDDVHTVPVEVSFDGVTPTAQGMDRAELRPGQSLEIAIRTP